jgi:hypothetical protein
MALGLMMASAGCDRAGEAPPGATTASGGLTANVEPAGHRVGSHSVALVTSLAGSPLLAVGVSKTQPPGTPRNEVLGHGVEIRVVDGPDEDSKAAVTLVSPQTTCVGRVGRRRWIEVAATAEWVELRELSGCQAAPTSDPQVAVFGAHPALRMTALSEEKRVDGKKVDILVNDGSAKQLEARTAVPGTDVEAVAAAAPESFAKARLEIRRGGKVLLERPIALAPSGALDLGRGVLLLVFKSWDHASIVAVEASSARLITEDPANNVPLPKASAVPAAPAQTAAPSEPVPVTAADATCTTEPWLLKPELKPDLRARPAGAGAVRLGVVGRGDWCNAQWTAARTGDQITILPTPANEATPCGTCAITLTLSSLPAGTWHLTLGGATLTASSR